MNCNTTAEGASPAQCGREIISSGKSGISPQSLKINLNFSVKFYSLCGFWVSHLSCGSSWGQSMFGGKIQRCEDEGMQYAYVCTAHFGWPTRLLRMPFTDFSSERWDFPVPLISFTSPQHTNRFLWLDRGDRTTSARGQIAGARLWGPALGVVPRFHPASCTLSI